MAKSTRKTNEHPYATALTLTLFLTIGIVSFASVSHSETPPIDLTKGVPVSEEYRKEFLNCDNNNTFRGINLPAIRWCSRDKNNLTTFLKFGNDGILTISKLGVDLDGSWYACNTPGHTDQCPTSVMLPYPPSPRVKPVPVDSDVIPYVAIPAWGPTAALANEFKLTTKLGNRAVGVVFYKDKGPIPIIVADGGPFNKFGEGSMALHRALGRELCAQRDNQGRCVKVLPAVNASIESDVTIIFFTNSELTELTAENISTKVKQEAFKRWDAFKRKYGQFQ